MEEVNFIVLKYLQENGFPHSAFVFETESIQNSDLEFPPNALINVLQRSLLELNLESQIIDAEQNENFKAKKELQSIKEAFPMASRSKNIQVKDSFSNFLPPILISQATATTIPVSFPVKLIQWSPSSPEHISILLTITTDGSVSFNSISEAHFSVKGNFNHGAWLFDCSEAILVGAIDSFIVSNTGNILYRLPSNLNFVAAAPSSPFFVVISSDGSDSLYDKNGSLIQKYEYFTKLSNVCWCDNSYFAVSSSEIVALQTISGTTKILEGVKNPKQIAFSDSSDQSILAIMNESEILLFQKTVLIKTLQFEKRKPTVFTWDSQKLIIGVIDSSNVCKLMSYKINGESEELLVLPSMATAISINEGKLAIGMKSGQIAIIGKKEPILFYGKSAVKKMAWCGGNLAVAFKNASCAIISTELYID